ncbi:MAG: hypothetical protein ACUVSQ_01570 [Pseudanabaenaceae cyanobacterium]
MKKTVWWAIALGLIWLVGWGPALASGDPAAQWAQLQQKLTKVRFCQNDSCFYRRVEARLQTPAETGGTYQGTITAIIDRPAATLDTAEYRFTWDGERWVLTGGEEYTDVADYFFQGDRYEIFSVHGTHSYQGDIATARQNRSLKSGYLTLYFDVLDQGRERPAKGETSMR